MSFQMNVTRIACKPIIANNAKLVAHGLHSVASVALPEQGFLICLMKRVYYTQIKMK
ncbi:hypothetical protein [Photobacterium piscicola]|uniref:hypothetical protein n=1 Tax=Photobacterium piscicola TaxID=1378299 RepID=UPI0013566C98|nr:hypothetical protein [Photobacterium piscicola]